MYRKIEFLIFSKILNLFRYPKYRIRECSSWVGEYIAEAKLKFSQKYWNELEINGRDRFKTIQEAQQAIEKYDEHYQKKLKEKKRKRYCKSYTPVGKSPLEKALE